MSDDAYSDSNVNGLVSAQMGICHVATDQGHEVTFIELGDSTVKNLNMSDLRKEHVEQADTLCCTLTHTKCTGLAMETASTRP